MKLRNDRELENTRAKLRLLEEGYEGVRQDADLDPLLRDAEMESLKSFIDQLKEEIAWYEAHYMARH